jgi:broad specificity phosphatase PhoE
MNEFKSPEQFIESKEKFGRNVEVHGRFIRHGEKLELPDEAETGLTKEGKQDSIDFGKRLEPKTAIKGYSSDTDRTKETIQLIVENSPTEKKMKQRIKDELYVNYSSEFRARIMEIKKRELREDFDEQSIEERKKRLAQCGIEQMNFYLSFKDKRPDEKTYSPVETAAQVARRVDLYIRMADKMHSGSHVDLMNGMHDVNIAVFLNEVMIRKVDGQKKRGFDSIQDIGGPIDYHEGFDIVTRIDENSEKTVKMIFRDKEYDIDLKRLGELVEIAKKLEKEEKRNEY